MLKIYPKNDKLFSGNDYFSYQKLNAIKLYFLHQDLNCSYFDKEILLYNHEILNDLSSVAIITDNFILINEIMFHDLFQSYQPTQLEINYLQFLNKERQLIESGLSQEELIEFNTYNKEIKDIFNHKKLHSTISNIPIVQFIQNLSTHTDFSINNEFFKTIISNPIKTLSDENFFKYLNTYNLLEVSSTLENEIKNSKKSFLNFKSRLDFSNQHKEYLLSLKNKSLPSFIFNYNSLLIKNDTERADILLDYFIKTTCDEIKSFSSLSFALVVHTIFNHDFFDTHNAYINKNSFKNKGIHLIYNYRELDLEERDYLISCGSGLLPSDFLVQFVPESKLIKSLKF